MKKQTKRFLMVMLILFGAVSAFFSINASGKNTFASTITPHPSSGISLTADLSGTDTLEIQTLGGGSNYWYQYWIKSKVIADGVIVDEELIPSNNLASERYIWKLLNGQGYIQAASAQTVVNENVLDENGKYCIIVRIKDTDGNFVDEVYAAYSPSDIGKTVITGISVNGIFYGNENIVIEKDTSVSVNVSANIAAGVNYSLYYGESQSYLQQNTNGKFDINGYGAGLHKFRIEADNGLGKDIKYISLYVYDMYKGNERPVIASFTGQTLSGTSTVFTMNVEYADGTPIPYALRNNFTYSLMSGRAKPVPKIIDTGDGTFKVEFDTDYQNKHGIYRTVASVSRNSVNGADDSVIQYYSGFARTGAWLKQSSSLGEGVSTSDAGVSITITADGYISDDYLENELLYAFYREDASGWVLIRNYSDDKSMVWTPARGGTYNIQARVKAPDGGEYEAVHTVKYIIDSDSEIPDGIGLQILNYVTKQPIGESSALVAGKPYILSAQYSDNMNLLYMFTLSTQKLGLVYLNNYTTDGRLIFVPSVPGQMTLSARVINADNFGYQDISVIKTVGSGLDLELDYTFDGANDDSFMVSAYNSADYSGIVTEDGRSVIKATTLGGVGDNGIKIDFNGINVSDLASFMITLRSSDYATIRANSIGSASLGYKVFSYSAPWNIIEELKAKSVTTLNSLYITGGIANIEICIDKIDIVLKEDFDALAIDYDFDDGSNDADLFTVAPYKTANLYGIVTDSGKSVYKAVANGTGNTGIYISLKSMNVADIASFKITLRTSAYITIHYSGTDVSGSSLGYWQFAYGAPWDIKINLKDKGVQTLNGLYFSATAGIEICIDKIDIVLNDGIDALGIDYDFNDGVSDSDMLMVSGRKNITIEGIITDSGRSVVKAVSGTSGTDNATVINFNAITVADLQSVTINYRIVGGALSLRTNPSSSATEIAYLGATNANYASRDILAGLNTKGVTTLNTIYFTSYPNITLYIDSIVIVYK